jgi:hypothetical protein
MADFRKRLASFFKRNSTAGGSEGSVEVRVNLERLTKEPPIVSLNGEATVTPAQVTGSLNPSPQIEGTSAPGKAAGHFENSGLLLEIKSNSVTAKAPWSGKLISFQTAAWDRKPSELDLPAAAMEELNEAYVCIRLANRLVWLSEDLGRSSEEIGENYKKMSKNIAERLDRAMLLATGGIEQTSKPLEPAAVIVEKNQEREPGERRAAAEPVTGNAEKKRAMAELVAKQAAERRVAAELVARDAEKKRAMAEFVVKQAVEQKVAAEPVNKQAEEKKAVAKPVAKQTEKRKVAAQRSTKQARGRKVADEPGVKVDADEDDSQPFQGLITLYIARGTQGLQITALMNSLTETQEIKVLSSGGAAGQRSWVILSIDTAMPLLQVLGKMSIVRKVSKRGNEVEVVLTAA